MELTARQIAERLGVKRQAVQRRLRKVRESGITIMNGNETKVWSLDALPPDMRTALDERNGNASSAKPVPSLADCHADEIDAAVKLRSALARALENRNNPAADVLEIGLADYVKVFGHSVSARHWRRMYQRALTRAGENPDFSRLDYFLSEQPRLKAAPAAPVPEDDGLAALRRGIGKPMDLTLSERRWLWTMAVEWYRESVATGRSDRQVKGDLFDFLQSNFPGLSSSRDGLRKAFCRQLADPGREDKRAMANAGRAKTYDPELIEEAAFVANFKYRRRIAPAVRELLGFEPERLDFRSGTKSYVPKTLLREVSREVNALAPFFKGPRAADAASPSLDLVYDGIHSLDCVVLDDFTFNVLVAVYRPDGSFERLSRCQLILAIDFRTLRVLEFGLMPEEQPNSLVAWGVCRRVFINHGLPKALYLERGRVFKDSVLMSGTIEGQRIGRLQGWDYASNADLEIGWRKLGVKMIHAKRARSKPIERVGDLIQSLMDGEPGWVGRDERRERPEAVTRQMYEVSKGQVHPSKYFYSFDQYEHRLLEVFEQYNRTVQEGKRLAGLSPDQAFQLFWPNDDPPTQFDPRCAHLVTTCSKHLEVIGGAVSFTVRGERYTYRDDRLSPCEGDQVHCRWDPELPDFITVIAKRLRNRPLVVGRNLQVNALAALIGTDEARGVLEEETAKVQRHMSFLRTRYRSIKAQFEPKYRKTLVANHDVRVGDAIDQARSQLESNQRDAITAHKTRTRLAGKLGRRPEELPKAAMDYDVELKAALRGIERDND